MSLFAALSLGVITAVGADTGPTPPPLQLTTEHYELDLVLDYPNQMLRGTARLTLANVGQEAVSDVPLLLYRLMSVGAVRDGEGRELAFRQDVVRFEDFDKLQVTAVQVRLPTALAPGGRTTLEVAYDGHLLGYSETGMLYVQDRIDPAFTILRDDAFAFPTLGVPSATANRSAPSESYDYVARITVPDSLYVANGGRLVSTRSADGTKTFEYRSLRPSWRMDFAIGHYGLLERSSLRVLYLREDSAGAARVARSADACTALFTEWFGPLEGAPPLTFLEIPDGWGSQKDVTTIIQTAAAFRDSTRMVEVYHELAHLWQPEITDRPSPRWNEGLAMFLQVLAAEKLDARSVVDASADQRLARLRREVAANARLRDVPMVDYGKERMTDFSYSVGQILFDLLYRVAGPRAFDRALAEYYHAHARDGGSTAELEAAFAAASAVDPGPIFHDWLDTTAWVDALGDAADIRELATLYGAAAGG